MFYRTDDPVRDAERYYSELEKASEKLPKCVVCLESIQDEECYNIYGDIHCKKCVENMLVDTEDFIK